MAQTDNRAATYTLCSDPGNAWLRVPVGDLLDLKATGPFAGDSRMTENYAYLDFDAADDAERFLGAARDAGWDVTVSLDIRHEEVSTVRQFGPLDTAFLLDPPAIGDEVVIPFAEDDAVSSRRGRIIHDDLDIGTGQAHFVVELADKTRRAIDKRFASAMMTLPKHSPTLSPGA
ncbi:MAG: hypothetical protein Alpg2KO_26180 [Alphaproteobacteria bacterium]